MKKVLNVAVCLTLIVAAIVYAAKNPFTVGDLVGYSTKSTLTGVETNGWIVLTGGSAKDKVVVTAGVDKKKIILDTAKVFQTKKIPGNLDTLLIGSFGVNVVGDIAGFAPGPIKLVKMKGATIGTVISKALKLVLADSVAKVATDGGFKGKGVTVKTKAGNVGGTTTDRGWLGVPDGHPLAAQMGEGVCTIKGAVSKAAIDNLDIYAKPFKAGKGKLKGKTPGTVTVAAGKASDWTKLKNVTVTERGGTTNVVEAAE